VKSYNRFEEGICVKERESLSLIQRRKEGSKGIYLGTNKKEIYSTVKVTTDCASILCREEGWKEKNSTRLLVSQ